MFEKFAQRARSTVDLAKDEACRRGDRRISTEHLLIGLLHDPSIAATVGADPDDARRIADGLDRDALAAIGIDISAFGSLERAQGAARLPFTPGAKAVLARTVAHARTRHIQSSHLLDALLECRPPDPASEILTRLRDDH
jgi:ATP-dependent Clp protease ATP-binding subunit ClpA